MCGISWHRHDKGLGGCNFPMMSYVVNVSYPDGMVGILSLQDIVLEGSDNTYKGTKYAAFLTELNNRLLYMH